MSIPSEVLDLVLRPPETPFAFEDPVSWWKDHAPRTRAYAAPIDAAIVNAARVDRLGFAFAGAYHAALRLLVPQIAPDRPVALAATEGGSAHPRSIATTIDA